MASRNASFGLVIAVLFFVFCHCELEDRCIQTCDNTYQGKLYSVCKTGCTIFSMMDVQKKATYERSTKSCMIECANYTKREDWRTCRVGCEYGMPSPANQADTLDGTVEFLYPMLQMHRLYSTVFDHMWQQIHVQWSYFLKKDSGQVLVIKSQPHFVVAFVEIDMSIDKTPLNPEMNLETVDLSATPNMKHSQVRSVDGLGPRYTQKDPQTYYADWLDCMSNKTGMPHVMIIIIVVVCLLVMVWLCITATSSSPSSKQSKLSINGDLQYMKDMGMESLMKYDSPHDRIHGNKIPFKISIQKV